MVNHLEKGINSLKNQLNDYFNVPITQKILPLIGFCFYILVIPQLLIKLIPQQISYLDNYLTLQSQQTLIYILSIILGNSLTVIGYSIFIYFIYTKKINLEKYRISLNKPWPWQQNPVQWNILLKKTVKSIFLNTIVIGIIVLIIWALIFERKVIFSQQLPSYSTILWQLMLFMIVQDMTSTTTHTFLHSPRLYWIHKKHHQYTTTISIAAQYAHPIEFVFSNSFPTVIGFKVLSRFYPVHIVTAIAWLIYRILLTSDLHSGYEFPWDVYKLLPFSAPASYHDYHHSHNVGNFASSFMLIEALNGNNDEYYKYMKNKKLLDKKQNGKVK